MSEIGDRRERHRVEQPFLYCHHQRDFVGQPQRRVLDLVEDRPNMCTARKLLAHICVRHTAEAGKAFEFEKLGIIKPQCLRSIAQRARLGLATHPTDAGPDIDRRFLPLVEQLGV